MKNSDSNPRRLKFGSIWDRLISVGTLAIFLYLVYLAINGRFDQEINQFAGWLERLFS
ncbi:MAG TPA: hypothetical protein VN247_05845 [Arenimonas sp.]|nr:hypothetical protein [Arenimonas sp.]